MFPTTTVRLPAVIAWASGTWIWVMSHCRNERASPHAAAAVVPADADVSTVIASTALVRVANPAVAVAPSTRRSSITALRNEALLERAMTTPISG